MCGSRVQDALGNILRAKTLERTLKLKAYQTIRRPVMLYRSRAWTLTQVDQQYLGIWKRKVLRTIYVPECIGGVWRRPYNSKL